tara:strand:- start:6136 stop:6504 length:369 start_codon:yes stop_codon:yes gene_type:complete
MNRKRKQTRRRRNKRKRTQKLYKQNGGNFAHMLSSIPVLGSFFQDGVNVFRGAVTGGKNLTRRWKGRKDAVSPMPYKNQLRHKPNLIVQFPNVKKTLNRNKQYVKGINSSNKEGMNSKTYQL